MTEDSVLYDMSPSASHEESLFSTSISFFKTDTGGKIAGADNPGNAGLILVANYFDGHVDRFNNGSDVMNRVYTTKHTCALTFGIVEYPVNLTSSKAILLPSVKDRLVEKVCVSSSR